MNPEYNVLHIVPTRVLSGAERIIQLIARHLDRETFKPIIVCGGDPLRQVYEEEGFSVEVANTLLPTPGNLSHLRAIIKKHNIHLIHAHDHRASLQAWMATRFLGRIPLVSHIHNTNPWMKKWHPFKLTELVMRNRYDISIACSETVRDYFSRYNRCLKSEKLVTITNGINMINPPPVHREAVTESLGIPGDHFIFGTVGRLGEQKGIDLLLEAFQKIASCALNATLLIVGTGPDESILKLLAEKLGVSNRVVFAGYRDDVYSLMQIMDAFVLASRWEGLPMVLMEAMSLGLPVIATGVGGVGELVKTGDTGVLVPTGDISALAESMLHLYYDEKLAKKLALAGRELVNNSFNILRQVKRMESIYSKLLRGEDPCSGENQYFSCTF